MKCLAENLRVDQFHGASGSPLESGLLAFQRFALKMLDVDSPKIGKYRPLVFAATAGTPTQK